MNKQPISEFDQKIRARKKEKKREKRRKKEERKKGERFATKLLSFYLIF